MIALNKWHRNVYNTDLSKMAVQAYDVMTYYCSSFFLGDDKPSLMMNNFEMKQISEMDGYENTNVFIVELEEFELLNAERELDD